MNFDPTIPFSLAIFMSLLAASMWGSWFITLKYLGDYPLEAFYITLFVTSMVVVWGLGFLIDGSALVGNIKDVWNVDPSRIYVTLICGSLYVIGMQLSLRVMKIIGLALSQPIQSSINVIGGTAIAAMIGGVPSYLTIPRISFAVLLLLFAVYLSIASGRIRDKAQKAAKINTGLSKDPKQIMKAFIMIAFGAAFIPAYSTALSYGLHSITQPNGMAVLPFMAILCTGAFIGALITCLPILIIRKQLTVFFKVGFNIHKLGMIAGTAHYGGNIIHTFATRNLSSVVSWPLGITAGLWTQVWGLAYGEFEGSPKSAYILLVGGFLFYVLGVFVLTVH
jgi:hypothetical protein